MDYYRMDLKIVKEVLHIPISLKALDKDFPDVIDLLYNMDKIYERAMVNAEVAKEENDDVMHQVRHIIQ